MSLARHITLFVLSIMPLFVSGQTEAELKAKAEQLFTSEQYVEATPLFLHLLSLQPRDHDYNYKYGTCLLFNSYKKQDALKYLTYAVKGAGIDPAAFYFLGRAYHLNYQFNDAIREYKSYQTKAGPKGVYTAAAIRNSEMCVNGKKLLSSLTEIIVTKKTEITQADFFRIYNLTNIGGSIIVGQDFQSKNDKKRGHLPLVHFPQGAQKVFFSSYGDEDQLDLYVVRRLPDGKFGIPQKIMGGVNTPFDEDYPYMHPNGDYLYFSSKGHNSMGGFDVFRARFDEENNSFGQVENIDFAISSPDDDMFYMVDKDDKNAYFASTRQSQDGKIFVYEVLVDRVPIQLAVVKGAFSSTVHPENKKMSVDVVDVASGKSIGKFNTTTEGGYLITFPKGGKYEYRVSVDGNPEPFVSQVDIPYLKEFKPLKQKIVHEQVENGEQVRITNLFNEEVEDAQAIIAQVLKERSNLNVNVGDYNLEELSNEQESRKVLSSLGMDGLSMREVAETLERKAVEINRPSVGAGAVENAVNAKVAGIYETVLQLDKKARELVQEADQTESDVVRFSLLNEARETMENRNDKLKQASELQGLEGQLTPPVENTAQKEAFTSLAEEVARLMRAGEEQKALSLLTDQQDVAQAVLKSNAPSLSSTLAETQKKLDAELQQLNRNEELYTTQIRDLEAEIRTLEEQKGNVKEKFRQEYQDKIDAHSASVKELEEARTAIRQVQTTKANERKDVASRLEIMSELEQYSGETVTDQQVEQAKKKLNQENARTLEQYIAGELKDLTANNPELNGANSTATPTDRIISSYNAATENALQKGDPVSKSVLSDLVDLNRQAMEELEQERAALNRQLSDDPQNESASKQLEKLERFATKLEGERNELEIRLEAANEEVIAYTQEDIQEAVYPEYSQNLAAIRNNTSLDKAQRLEQLIEEQETYAKRLELELEETNAQLEQEPGDKTLQNKRSAIRELSDELNTELAANRVAYEKEAGTNETEVGAPYMEIVRALGEAYTSQRTMVAQQNVSDEERREILQKITNNYLAELEKQEDAIATLNSPNDASLKTALAEIREVKNEATQYLQEQLTAIPEDKNSFITGIDADYQNDIAAINEKEGSAKYEELMQRETALQQNIEARLAQNQQATTNPERLELENQWLMEELQASIARNNEHALALQTMEQETTALSEAEKIELLEEVRSKVDSGIVDILSATERNLSALEEQDVQLQTYEQALQTAISESRQSAEAEGVKQARLAVLTEELEQVQEKRRSIQVTIDDIQQQTVTQETVALSKKEKVAYRETVRTGFELLNETAIEQEENEDHLKEYDQQLEAYEEKLMQLIREREESETNPRIDSELEILNDELEEVRSQRRLASVRIGELEQQALNAVTTNPVEIGTESTQEQALKARLAEDGLTTQERRSLEKELAEVTEARMEQENPVLRTEIEQNESTVNEQRGRLEKTSVSAELTNYFDTELKEVERLTERALEADNTVEQNYLLKEVEQQQTRMRSEMEEVLLAERERELESNYATSDLVSTEQLEARKRTASVEIGNITHELERLREARASSKSKERATFDTRIDQLEKRLNYLRSEVMEIDRKLEERSVPEVSVDTEGLKTALTYNEERNIAASEEYEAYARAMEEVLELNRQLNEKEEQLVREQEAIQRLIQAELSESVNNEQEIRERASAIRSYSVEIGELNQSLSEAKTRAAEALPENEDERMKFQNLALRGVNPLKKAVIATALVPLPAAGIEINESAAATSYTAENPIPIDVENPSGLVYRVQVGAFAKPIPQDLFKEFTPVSGEVIPNTNVTRYMAGFFNSSAKVVEVREQIRALGYADAFVVAYCDGERISFGEARRMEASGECVPQGTDELLLDVATKTVQKMGLEDTTKRIQPVSEYSYNQAPGAAPARPIEQYDGLFFTVQIGVYNTPVSHERLLKLEPLLTLRLENGQIRYSCGMFEEVKPAKLLEAEIHQKGIIDAFVVAYYKGKRITWQRAEEILREQGKGILASLERPDKQVEKNKQPIQSIPVFEKAPRVEVTEKERGGVQIVSKKTYSEYPRDVVNRYNNKGVFYYDQTDGKVKSVIYDSKLHLPRVQAFKDDVDTVFYTESELADINGNVLVVRMDGHQLPGDVADWVLRLPHRRAWLNTQDGLELRIFAIEEVELMALQREVEVFGLESEVLSVKKEE